MKGKTLLKVTGILMIIGFAVCLFFGFIALIAVLNGMSYASENSGALMDAAVAETGMNFTLLLVSAIVSIASAIVEFIAGIFGIKYCKRPEKAGKCLVTGIICCVLTVVSVIFFKVGNYPDYSPVTSLISGLLIPGLYVLGAILNKTSAPAPVESPVEASEE